jgi:hypothetical protein
MSTILGFSELNNENTEHVKKNLTSPQEYFSNKIQQKKLIRNSNKTRKINEILESIDSDDEDDNLHSLLPPPPQLQSQTKQIDPSKLQYNTNTDTDSNHLDNEVSQEAFNNLENGASYRENYYKQYVPYYTNTSNNQSLDGEKDLLIEKLNYMIHLLEEQKEEKTGHITEELILYSFLGVFIIFVIDSFARAGKYVR